MPSPSRVSFALQVVLLDPLGTLVLIGLNCCKPHDGCTAWLSAMVKCEIFKFFIKKNMMAFILFPSQGLAESAPPAEQGSYGKKCESQSL